MLGGFLFLFLLNANVVICFFLHWISLGGEPVALVEEGFRIAVMLPLLGAMGTIGYS
jgi:hypothetical protein